VEPPERILLPDGRAFGVDDVGDRRGRPIVYLHGTPDSRLARHPDDAVAARLGVRLLAVDRPGSGESDPHPAAGLTSIGDDLRALLDALGIERAALLGWSSGGLAALAAASVLGHRASAVTLVATMPPVEAYADAAVLAALGPARRTFAELARDVPPAELAAEMAPYLLPMAITSEVALEHVLENAGPLGRSELAAVPGAAEQLALALQEAVREGLAGVEHDLELQLTPGLDLATVGAPVRLVHGSADEVSPPAVGEWLAERLPEAALEVVATAGHHLLFTQWADLLAPGG